MVDKHTDKITTVLLVTNLLLLLLLLSVETQARLRSATAGKLLLPTTEIVMVG